MFKLYKAKTILALNVKVGEKCAHVSFDALSNGDSIFRTESEELQKALAAHRMYGKLFFEVEEPVVPVVENTSIPEEDQGPIEITVTSPNEAKDYLSDRLGISRTNLKTIAAIKRVAEENNIVFIGLD